MLRTRPDQFTLLYEREHAGQGVTDNARAILIHFAAQTNWVGHIAPDSCARFFKFPEQERFFSAMRKQCLDCLEVRAGHRKNVRGAIDQRRCERLAPQIAYVCAFFRAHLYRIKAWRLTAYVVDTSRENFDVLTIANQTAKKPFRDRAATNITCADKEDAFHDSGTRSERVSQPRIERSQVNFAASWSALRRAHA